VVTHHDAGGLIDGHVGAHVSQGVDDEYLMLVSVSEWRQSDGRWIKGRASKVSGCKYRLCRPVKAAWTYACRLCCIITVVETVMDENIPVSLIFGGARQPGRSS